jgi:hypothetical protein
MIRRVLALLNPRYRFRSAIDGRFVSRVYAFAHPSTTISERVKP